LGYLAPEVQGLLDDDETEYDEYTNAVDVWSLGCVASWLLTQEVPFPSIRTKAGYVWGSIEFPLAPLLAKRITKEGLAFIRNAMAVQPLNRFTASTALDDRWLNNVNNTPHPDPRLQNDALHTSGGFLTGMQMNLHQVRTHLPASPKAMTELLIRNLNLKEAVPSEILKIRGFRSMTQ
jgi:serine/threonine protein kinase